MSGIRGLMGLGGMVMCKLGMLGRVCLIALFMGLGGFSMRLCCVFVVGCCIVVIVFWHCFSLVA